MGKERIFPPTHRPPLRIQSSIFRLYYLYVFPVGLEKQELEMDGILDCSQRIFKKKSTPALTLHTTYTSTWSMWPSHQKSSKLGKPINKEAGKSHRLEGKKSQQDQINNRNPRDQMILVRRLGREWTLKTILFSMNYWQLSAIIKRTQPTIKVSKLVSLWKGYCHSKKICPTFPKSKTHLYFGCHSHRESIPKLWPLWASREQACKLALALRPLTVFQSYQVQC